MANERIREYGGKSQRGAKRGKQEENARGLVRLVHEQLSHPNQQTETGLLGI